MPNPTPTMPVANTGPVRDFLGSGNNTITQMGLDLLGSGERNLAALPAHIEEVIAAEIIRVNRTGLVLANDLLAAGLSIPYPNWLAKTKYTQNRGNAGVNAKRTMDLDVRGERAILDSSSMSWPIFATSADFSEGVRTVRQYDAANNPFGATMTGESVEAINKLIDDQGWNGWMVTGDTNSSLVKVDDATAPGLLTAPVNTYDYSGSNPAWNHPSKKPTEIVADVQAMAAVLRENGNYLGPFRLYVSSTYGDTLNNNFTDGVTTFPTTTRQRLQQLEYGGQPLQIRVAPQLPTNKTVLIQFSRDVIEILAGQSPDVISWVYPNASQPMRYYWMIVACMVILIKTNYYGHQGWVVGDIP